MTKTIIKLYLNGLLDYLRNVKIEIEKDGMIATIDEAINRVEGIISMHDCHKTAEDGCEICEHEHADSVDADGTCLQCGKTNLI